MKKTVLFFLLLIFNLSAFSQNKFHLGVHLGGGSAFFEKRNYEEYNAKPNVMAGIDASYQLLSYFGLEGSLCFKTRNYNYYSKIYISFPELEEPVTVVSDQDFKNYLAGISLTPFVSFKSWKAGAGLYFDYFISETKAKPPQSTPSDFFAQGYYEYDDVRDYNVGWTVHGGRKFSILKQDFELQLQVNHLLSDRHKNAKVNVDGYQIPVKTKEAKYYECFLKLTYVLY